MLASIREMFLDISENHPDWEPCTRDMDGNACRTTFAQLRQSDALGRIKTELRFLEEV